MDAHEAVTLTGLCRKEKVQFPQIDITDSDFAFFPYRMRLGDALLKYALATPLCCLHTTMGDTYVFYGDREPQFTWEGETEADILHLSRQDALRAFRVKTDQEYLILADHFVWEEEGEIRVTGECRTVIQCFPKLTKDIPGFRECGQKGRFTIYERQFEEQRTGF